MPTVIAYIIESTKTTTATTTKTSAAATTATTEKGGKKKNKKHCRLTFLEYIQKKKYKEEDERSRYDVH
jgi:hypothetical protein